MLVRRKRLSTDGNEGDHFNTALNLTKEIKFSSQISDVGEFRKGPSEMDWLESFENSLVELRGGGIDTEGKLERMLERNFVGREIFRDTAYSVSKMHFSCFTEYVGEGVKRARGRENEQTRNEQTRRSNATPISFGSRWFR